MSFWQSIRFKIVIAFALILVPIVAFLIYDNLYAADIVRQQVSLHYDNSLDVQVLANDAILKATTDYLTQLGTNTDNDILSLKTLSIDDPDYTLTKLRIYNRFVLDTGYYNMVDTFFIYVEREKAAFFATQATQKSTELYQALNEYSGRFITGGPAADPDRWDLISIPGDYQYLIKMVDLGLGVYAGALVRTDSLIGVLDKLDVGPEGAVYMLDAGGRPVTSVQPPDAHDASFRSRVLSMARPYETMQWKGERLLVLQHPSAYSDVRYVIVTPESYMLKNLPFFQKVLYLWIPLIVAGVLTGYLIFLQRFMFRPLVRLIRGMRKLGQGQFDVRLSVPADGSEFAFMSSTFNQMAQQIEKLKIDVYEERIRVQRAEYKHLQIQINPHFYMNSLNIIYNLAALKDYKSVQKLSLHLADYFRFLMHGDRAAVRLEDEIRHIGHYLEIQKWRYVDRLDYVIRIEPRHLSCEIPPLLLQPFVENSIIHGFNRRPPDGLPFRIEVASEDDARDPDRCIRLTIRDNGPGFPGEMLERLSSGDYLAGSGEEHLGIWNILRRFKMLYGNEGGIVFRTAETGGAVVEVRLPVVRSAELGDPDRPGSSGGPETEEIPHVYHAGGGR